MAKIRTLFDFGRVTVAAGGAATITLAMDRGCTQVVLPYYYCPSTATTVLLP